MPSVVQMLNRLFWPRSHKGWCDQWYLQICKDFLLSRKGSRPPRILDIRSCLAIYKKNRFNLYVSMIWNNRKGSLSLSFFVANLSANHNSQSHICVSINCWLNFNCWTFCRIRSNWPTLWKAKSQIWNIFNRSKAIKQIRHRPRPWLLLRFF